MLVKTGTVAVNAAFLRELKEDNETLRGLLAELSALCVPRLFPRPTRKKLAQLLPRLRDELAMHFSLEDAYGYFDRPASVAPQLSERARRLRDQHAELYEEIAQIAEAAEDAWSRCTSPTEELEGPVRKRLVGRCRVFWIRLQQHEANEHELIRAAGCCADHPARNVVTGCLA